VAGLALLPISFAAPVPKAKPNPFADKLVGTWDLQVDGANYDYPPWGSFRVSISADGKVSCKDSTWIEVTGTYKLLNNELHFNVVTRFHAMTGESTEIKRNDVLIVVAATYEAITLEHKSETEQYRFTIERVQPAAKPKTD
jgi:hypothetical protein